MDRELEARSRLATTRRDWRLDEPPAQPWVTFEETPKTVDFIAQVGPARGAWFKDPDGNVIGVREGPVPTAG